ELERRSAVADVEAWNVGDDRRHVGPDVRALGEQGRVAGDVTGLEAVAGVAGAREGDVDVARPGREREAQGAARVERPGRRRFAGPKRGGDVGGVRVSVG